MTPLLASTNWGAVAFWLGALMILTLVSTLAACVLVALALHATGDARKKYARWAAVCAVPLLLWLVSVVADAIRW